MTCVSLSAVALGLGGPSVVRPRGEDDDVDDEMRTDEKVGHLWGTSGAPVRQKWGHGMQKCTEKS